MARPVPCCDVEVYGGGDGILLPRALRINGEAVYTPVGTHYELVGGGKADPLVLRLTILPTSLKFLPGDPPAPDDVKEADDDAA